MDRVFSIRVLNEEMGYTNEGNLTKELYEVMTKLANNGYGSKIQDIFKKFIMDNGGVSDKIYFFDSRDMKEIIMKINSLYQSKYNSSVRNNSKLMVSVVEAVTELYSDKYNYTIFFGESLMEAQIDKLVEVRVSDFGKKLAALEQKYIKDNEAIRKCFRHLFYSVIQFIESGFLNEFTAKYESYYFLRYGVVDCKSVDYIKPVHLMEFLKFSNFKSLDDMFKMYVLKKTGELISYMSNVTGDLT